jgi:hypothetical protein
VCFIHNNSQQQKEMRKLFIILRLSPLHLFRHLFQLRLSLSLPSQSSRICTRSKKETAKKEETKAFSPFLFHA